MIQPYHAIFSRRGSFRPCVAALIFLLVPAAPAALAGTVHIQPGTYNETLAVGKPVTLAGQGAVNTEVEIRGPEDQATIVISVDGATIQNVLVTHETKNGGGQSIGILAQTPVDTLSIQNCAFHNNDIAVRIEEFGANPDSSGIGILNNHFDIGDNGAWIDNDFGAEIVAERNYWDSYNPDIIRAKIEQTEYVGAGIDWTPFSDSTFTYAFDPAIGPTKVWVDDDYNMSTVSNAGDPDNPADTDTEANDGDGTEGLYWEWNAFSSINAAIDRVGEP